MQASYKHSTLSLAFIACLASIFLLIVIAIAVAIFAPEAYRLSSEEKTLVLVLIVGYLGFVSNIIGAYLGTRNPNKIPDDQIGVLAQAVSQQEQVTDDEDLSLNKLQAYDTTNQ